MKVIIGVMTINNLKYNKLCLKSLKCSHPHEIVVVDNGSTDGTVKWLKTQDITLIDNGVNLGMAYGMNTLYDHIWKDNDDNLFISLSNDVVIAENTIDQLVEAAQTSDYSSYKGDRHTASFVYLLDHPEDRRFFAGGNKIDVRKGAKRSPGPYYNLIEETADEFVSIMLSRFEHRKFRLSDGWSYWHNDSCKLFKKKCFDVMGYWDANYYPGYGVDTDHSWRAERLDERVGIVASCLSFSFWSRTAYESGVFPGNVRRADYRKDKWGPTPDNKNYDLPFNGKFPDKYKGYDTSQLRIASREGELERIKYLMGLATDPKKKFAANLAKKYESMRKIIG